MRKIAGQGLRKSKGREAQIHQRGGFRIPLKGLTVLKEVFQEGFGLSNPKSYAVEKSLEVFPERCLMTGNNL
jgi:hypothetical protein